MAGSSDSFSSADRKRKHKKRKKKSSKKSSKHKRHHDEESSDSSVDARKRKRHKSEKRKKRKRSEEPKEESLSGPLARNYALADVLCDMFEEHPALASDLPIMLVRMVNGTAFDLSQMTDCSAAQSLQNVFTQLTEFGLQQSSQGWTWKGPPGGTSDELILVKVIKAMVNEIGLTFDAVEDYEGGEALKAKKLLQNQQELEEERIKTAQKLRKEVEAALNNFTSGELNRELAGLCEMIMNGENVALDGLPDTDLRDSLESILIRCGLEKVEMEMDSDDEDDDGEKTFGFGLPESKEEPCSKLKMVMGVCETFSKVDGKSRRPLKGPMKNPADYAEYEAAHDSDDDSEEEGPSQMFNSMSKTPTKEAVKLAAEQRARQVMAAKGINVSQNDGTVREEWMLDPGKFDLLNAIKSKPATSGRQFQNKKGPVEPARPIAPAIKTEIDAIMEQHREARGPSLVEQHRSAKAAKLAAKSEDKDSWKWNRDKDLDSGRRVDKNALNMVLGGASDGLKSKFQGSYGRS